jgi:hypothetical protein
MAWTVAGARSGMNEYELHDHRREQNFRSIAGNFTNFSSSVNKISEGIHSQQATTGCSYALYLPRIFRTLGKKKSVLKAIRFYPGTDSCGGRCFKARNPEHRCSGVQAIRAWPEAAVETLFPPSSASQNAKTDYKFGRESTTWKWAQMPAQTAEIAATNSKVSAAVGRDWINRS